MEIQKDITIKIVIDNNEIKLLYDILYYAEEEMNKEFEKDDCSTKSYLSTLIKYNNNLKEELDKIVKCI